MSKRHADESGRRGELTRSASVSGGSLLQFIKFNMIGLLNTAIDMALFAVLVKLGVYYLAAQVIAYGAGMLNSLWMNSRFTFAASAANQEESLFPTRANRLLARAGLPDAATAIRFAMWNGMVLVFSLLLLAVFKERLALSEVQAKIVVTSLSVVINFVGTKKWVFATRYRQGERS